MNWEVLTMRSKTSCFNKTVFRKNLTRFAPVWVLYTLCLVLGLFLVYSNAAGSSDRYRDFQFTYQVSQMIQVMGGVNLGYALLVAQLLFGDLYNSRMCNALHALPLRREAWFVTNLLDGLCFSLIPTAVMALATLPLMSGSLFENAWQMAWWLFLGSNLEFICFFGIAAFAAMCVGNRFTMAAGYGLLNFGAYIVYWLVDTLYTPLLYGVITPTALAHTLTPFFHMTDSPFFEVSEYSVLRDKFQQTGRWEFAQFQLTDRWQSLLVCAGVGILFALGALLLYRRRKLECASDAVAFRGLVPVFQVLCAVTVAAGAQFCLYVFLGLGKANYLFPAVGLVVGWFVGKMLLERSTRVFRLKNFYGLIGLAAVFAITLGLTRLDVLGIRTRLPDPAKVSSVLLESIRTQGITLRSEADVEDILELQRHAAQSPLEDYGTYILTDSGEWVRYSDTIASLSDEEPEDARYRYATQITLTYRMENGSTMRRRYRVWTDSPAGQIAREYLSRWDAVDTYTIRINGRDEKVLPMVLSSAKTISFSYPEESFSDVKDLTRQDAEALIAAIQADCEAGTMAQDPFFHSGHFRFTTDEARSYTEKGYYADNSFWLSLRGEQCSWSIGVFPDSENTLRWLLDHGMNDVEILPHDNRVIW